MLFNSFEFFIFLPVVFVTYWLVQKKHLMIQNALILLASYVFYGWWDYRFLSLIALSTLVDYFVGLGIFNSTDNFKKKILLWISVIFNLGLLIFFKYYNFFIASWIDFLGSFGYTLKSTWTLNILLPVGISFYTFQTMSYSIDIYRGNLKPTRDIVAFGAFVSFFPQLVAGPIERASNLLPQILVKRKFSRVQFLNGLELIVWGLFKKVVIADTLAPIVNDIFINSDNYSGGTLIIGAIFFAFQIYGDFSGYSDIAIGTAKLFGFNLMLNFNFPYFSKSIAEFWRKWHISLSTWFRDYLYIPLGGSRTSKKKAIRNVFIIFIVSGFWHGANWTFIFWGLIHALLFIPSFLLGTNRNHLEYDKGKKLTYYQRLKSILKIAFTFSVVTFAWIFFRAESLSTAFRYILNIKSLQFDSNSFIIQADIILVVVLVILDYLRYSKIKFPKLIWLVLILAILGGLNRESPAEFIYFQF